MSYTPPAFNAADFSWVGVAAYTPPAFNQANFQWAPGIPTARGFLATKLGTPKATATVTLQAQGIKALHFGEHAGGSYHYGRPQGIKLVAFGQPAATSKITVSVPGVKSTGFGTPIGGVKAILRPASIGPLTSIPAPKTKTKAMATAPTLGRLAKAGRPVAKAQAEAQAASIGPLVKMKGARAKARITVPPDGLRAAGPGRPKAFTSFRAHGFKAVKFGAAIASWGRTARGAKVAKFGQHKAIGGKRFLVLETWGINLSGRIGQPVALNRTPRKAPGLRLTKIGTPKVTPSFRIPHIPPQTRFGRPRAIRNPA